MVTLLKLYVEAYQVTKKGLLVMIIVLSYFNNNSNFETILKV